MPTTLSGCAEILSTLGIRHHVDVAEEAIRLVFLTQTYRNLRDEGLAVVNLSTPDDGLRCRLTIERAFPTGRNAAATCLALCRLAAETPLVGVEYAPAERNLRLVIEAVVEDGDVTSLQLTTMIDRLIEAAETWAAALRATRRQPGRPAAA